MRRLIFWLPVLAVVLAISPPTHAQVLLTEINAANTISQDMQARNARAVSGAADDTGEPAPTTSSESVGMGGVKYIPAYAIVLMLVGLSTFIVCRPSRRHSAD